MTYFRCLALTAALAFLPACAGVTGTAERRDPLADAHAKAVADYDRSGLPDIAYIPEGKSELRVRWDGYPGDESVIAHGVPPNSSLSSADPNRDGKPDICVFPQGGAAQVYINLGGRKFSLQPPR